MKTKISLINGVVTMLITILFFSCAKNEQSEPVSTGPVDILVNADLSDFNEGNELTNNNAKSSASSLVDTSIQVNNNYFFRATLSPLAESEILDKKIIKKGEGKFAEVTAASMKPNVWYRLVVFKKKSGEYVTERVYQRGKENDPSISPRLLLDGGVDYTFVAFSVNSTDASKLPIVQGPSTEKNISNCYLSINEVSSDLLYFKKDQIISGESIDYLYVLFKHQFSEITVTIDARKVGYDILSANASLLAKNPTVRLNFSNNSVDRSGDNSTIPLVFSGFNDNFIESLPIVVNSGNISGADRFLNISNLKIGDITAPTFSTFANVNLVPGTKYHMKLELLPEDKLIDNYGGFGINAVRINGQVWMRHNLRHDGDYSVNPDSVGAIIFGNYYQWGRILPVSSLEREIINTPSNWTTVVNLYEKSWNAYASNSVEEREASPVKAELTSGIYGTTGDPCPRGYRVPTKNDFDDLLLYGNISYRETPIPIPGSDKSIAVLLSRRNASAKLTFPAQGTLVANPTTMTYNTVDSKGVRVRVWTSYSSFADVYSFCYADMNLLNASPVMVTSSRTNVLTHNENNIALPIRCIAINHKLAP